MRITSCGHLDRSSGRNDPLRRSTATRRRWIAVCSSAAGIALAAAACSSASTGTASSKTVGAGGNAATTSAAASSAAGAATGATPLRVATTSAGSILVDGTGKAVYVFAIDKPGHSACTGQCLQYWPIVPAPASLPATLPGITAKLGTLTRPDGSAQLTVNDYPVYTFAGDSGPGTTKGQGKNLSGGLWWVVAPDGKWITTTSGGGSSSSESSGGGSSGSGSGYSKGY
jgi:predicted lipoprotein with Yx(FWY)xxD motif